jgi:hypothetical protein
VFLAKVREARECQERSLDESLTGVWVGSGSSLITAAPFHQCRREPFSNEWIVFCSECARQNKYVMIYVGTVVANMSTRRPGCLSNLANIQLIQCCILRPTTNADSNDSHPVHNNERNLPWALFTCPSRNSRVIRHSKRVQVTQITPPASRA